MLRDHKWTDNRSRQKQYNSRPLGEDQEKLYVFLIENPNSENLGLKTNRIFLLSLLIPEMFCSASCVLLDLALCSLAKSHSVDTPLPAFTLFQHGGVSIYPGPSVLQSFGKNHPFLNKESNCDPKYPPQCPYGVNKPNAEDTRLGSKEPDALSDYCSRSPTSLMREGCAELRAECPGRSCKGGTRASPSRPVSNIMSSMSCLAPGWEHKMTQGAMVSALPLVQRAWEGQRDRTG